MADKDVCRRWILAIAQLRTRASKLKRSTVPADAVELVEQSLALCDSVVRDLAGSGLQFDAFRVKLDEQTTQWTYLFEEMPTPCIETDATGIIVNANRAAASLLNTSVKHLAARLLMHFSEDRDRFGNLLRGLSADVKHRSPLVIRPRERAPVQLEATVVQRTPGDSSSWLWFFTPPEQPRVSQRRHDKPPVEHSEPAAPLSL